MHHFTCPHLLSAIDPDYAKYFTGHGKEYALICLDCARNQEFDDLREIPAFRFNEIEREGYWECSAEGIQGEPEIRVAAKQLQTEEHALTSSFAAPIAAAAPAKTSTHWFVLLRDGKLLRIDFEKGTIMEQCTVESDLDDAVFLRISPDDGCAVVGDREGRLGGDTGRTATVFDLETGHTMISLDRGDYHSDVSHFPAAFFTDGHSQFLVAASDWNRLDIWDLETASIVTHRESPKFRQGDEAPEHYLDYFHANLVVSPDSTRIADSGWVWHPVGIVQSWSLERWLNQNVWESEDGSSLKSFCLRDYSWDEPMCWLDNERLAVWGYGSDEENLMPAVTLFNAVSGEELGWFPGPKRGELGFDEYLFACSNWQTSAWDVDSEERVLLLDSGAIAYHPLRHAFLSCNEEGFREITWRK